MNLIQSTFYKQILLMKEKSIWEFNPHSESFNVGPHLIPIGFLIPLQNST